MGKTRNVNASPSKQRARVEHARRPRIGRAIGDLGTVGDPHLFETAGFALCGTDFDPRTHMLYSGWPARTAVAGMCANCTAAYAAAKRRARIRKAAEPPIPQAPPPEPPFLDVVTGIIRTLAVAWCRVGKKAAAPE